MEEVKKQGMESLFVPYEIALDLKELGFDEPCFNYYSTPNHPSLQPSILLGINPSEPLMSGQMYKIGVWKIKAPLYQQAFRWFREKYGLYHSIGLDNSLENDVNCDYQIINHSQSISELETDFKSYEEAELECLKKLIEIVKEKK